MKNDFLKDLNPNQKKAVLNTDGPMIILAGAGSGKTRVLTHKVIYLILEKHVNPENILMTTFTNKAANEMKERIKKLLGENKTPFVGTFHSLCARILRIEGKHIGLSPKFLIYDTQDQVDAIKQAMKKLDLSIKDYKPYSILATISQAKNELIGHLEYQNFARGYFQEAVSKIYPIYQEILAENDVLDFDDLLLKTIFLFSKNQEVLEKYQSRFRYILVDEYQDTNKVQYILTKLLSKKWQNICVVGDFSQSIYSWRGADFQNLSKFKNDFKGTRTFELSQNYRSTQKILDAASSVISKNTTHPVLALWTQNPKGEDITIYEAKSEQDEAEYIVNQIKTFQFSPLNSHLSDTAILYRTNAQSRILEEVFLHNGLPYTLIGGTRFYERKEIKDVLSYLKVIENPKDSVSRKRIEKIGKKRLSNFLEIQESLKNIDEAVTIDLLDKILKSTEYLVLYDKDDEEDRQRLENIKELRSVATEFPDIHEFLENVALVEAEQSSSGKIQRQQSTTDPRPSVNEASNQQSREVVTLMTLHAAKGLEFSVVFIVGMEEGLFPHSRSLWETGQLEEARRLAYVGITRSKKLLYLS